MAATDDGGGAGTADTTMAWADDPRMSAFETAMWRAEVDPALSMTAMVGELLDQAPDWDRFVAAHEWASRMAPRFRQRVVEAPFGLGAPRWSDDPAFDLGYHVRRQRLPEGGGWPALLEAIAQVGMVPLDRTRPPWEVHLFEGLPDGKAMYLLKLHHATTDGMGAMQLLTDLHSGTREPNPSKPWPTLPPPQPTSSLGALGHRLRDDVEAVPGLLRALGSGALRAAAEPIQSVMGSADYLSSLARVVAPATEGSPLLAERSRSWRLAAFDIPFADLRGAGKAVGASINDAYLAGILGGFRRYHEAMGESGVDAIPISVPVSLRKPGEGGGGNHIATIQIAGPLHIVDPAKRILAIRDTVRTARDEPAVDVIGALSPAVARLPGTLIAALSGSLAKGNDVQASNVPGVPEGSFLAGGQVERMYGFGPLPGCAAMVILVTIGDTACVGTTVDAASITDPELFHGCLMAGFDEVLALGPGAGSTTRRT